MVVHSKDAGKKETVQALIRLLLKEQSDLDLHCWLRPLCLSQYLKRLWCLRSGNYKSILQISTLACDMTPVVTVSVAQVTVIYQHTSTLYHTKHTSNIYKVCTNVSYDNVNVT